MEVHNLVKDNISLRINAIYSPESSVKISENLFGFFLISVNIENYNPAASAEVIILSSNDLLIKNTKDIPDSVTPLHTQIQVGREFVYRAPAYSFSVIRLKSE